MQTRKVPLLITEIRRRNPSHRTPRYRISLVKEAGSVYTTARPITSARQVFEISKTFFEDADREGFYILCLDPKGRIIGINLVAIGSLGVTIIHPGEVFKAAILLNSASIISVHNHPSGDPTPSRHDNELTERLVQAGVLLGIPLKDHVICGEDDFFSYEERGLIRR